MASPLCKYVHSHWKEEWFSAMLGYSPSNEPTIVTTRIISNFPMGIPTTGILGGGNSHPVTASRIQLSAWVFFQENPDAELQGKLLAEDPNPIDTAKRTLKKELKQAQARRRLGYNISGTQGFETTIPFLWHIEYIDMGFLSSSLNVWGCFQLPFRDFTSPHLALRELHDISLEWEMVCILIERHDMWQRHG